MAGRLAVFVLCACTMLTGTATAFWLEECNGYAGPLPLASVNNSAMDCQLKQLAIDFALQTLGQARAAEFMPRLTSALNIDACQSTSLEHLISSGFFLDAAAAPSRSNSPPPGPSADASSHSQRRALTMQYLLSKNGIKNVDVDRVDIFSDATKGSDISGDGSESKPFATVKRALDAVADLPSTERKARVVAVWLRAGTYFEQVEIGAEHSGASAQLPTLIVGHPDEKIVLSGGAPLTDLEWNPTQVVKNGETVYKAELKKPLNGLGKGNAFTGLFANGVRLPRARYPNCDDITGTSCYTLNASGSTGDPRTPTIPIINIPGAINLEVKNQHGVDMFADAWDSAPATTAHGASDGTLPFGINKTLVVDHPDYAWRCHEDCGWVAYSKWRSVFANSSRFNTSFNQPYWDQQVSGGFYYNATGPSMYAPGWTNRSWSKPSTGVVHMYHTMRWGGWQFQLMDRNDTDHSLTFACELLDNNGNKIGDGLVPCPHDNSPAIVQGGWQEARGWSIGKYKGSLNNSYFVENIKEELDSPGEWFFDADEGPFGTIYLSPPDAASKGTKSAEFPNLDLVATIHKNVVSIIADNDTNRISNVILANVTIMHSATTYLSKFEVPSGGDWAIHRGGALFADGAINIQVIGCTFDQVDGNGVFLSRHVRHSNIEGNSFFAIGETAILAVGSSALQRTNMAQSTEYPAYNMIQKNLVDTVGVWVKQSAAYFKSIARENTIDSNIFMNGPRSAINFNDGFAGGEVLSRNLVLNFVRESNDHGPFNSWDRQPYIYRINESDPEIEPKSDGTPRLAISPMTHFITKNLIYSYNFHGPQCSSVAIDHDDESSQYHVEENVLVYGGIKFFDGMDRTASKNLIVYPYGVMDGTQCFHALSSTRNVSSAHTHFESNHCVMRPGEFVYNCGAGPAPFYNKSYHVHVSNNTFSWPGTAAYSGWAAACGCWPGPKTDAPQPCPIKTFNDWQSMGLDIGSTLQFNITNAEILGQAKELLQLQT